MAPVDTQVFKPIAVPGEKCSPEMTGDKAKVFYEEKDEKGNKFEIKCDGQLLGIFTRSDGTVVYIGKCIFPYGHNIINKKVLMALEPTVTPTGGIEPGKPKKTDPKYITPKQMQTITWKNIEPAGDPPKQGKKGDVGPKTVGAKDIMWVYDVATNKYFMQRTEHTGQWKKDGDGPDDWIWEVLEEKKLGDPSPARPAPGNKNDLLSMAQDLPGHSHVCTIIPPATYDGHTPVPFTVMDDAAGPRTYVARMPVGSDEFQFERIEATAGESFSFHIEMPHQEDEVISYALLECPAGMTIDQTMGTIAWTPTEDQVGTHRVVVRHAYGDLTPHEDSFVLRVNPPRPIGSDVLERLRALLRRIFGQ